jgi:hypothetical protein
MIVGIISIVILLVAFHIYDEYIMMGHKDRLHAHKGKQ